MHTLTVDEYEFDPYDSVDYEGDCLRDQAEDIVDAVLRMLGELPDESSVQQAALNGADSVWRAAVRARQAALDVIEASGGQWSHSVEYEGPGEVSENAHFGVSDDIHELALSAARRAALKEVRRRWTGHKPGPRRSSATRHGRSRERRAARIRRATARSPGSREDDPDSERLVAGGAAA